jgi:hypothetical protein
MFNRTDFNKTTFNRPLYSNVFVAALLSGVGDIYPDAVIDAVGHVLLEGRGTLELTVSQQGEVLLSGIGGISVDALKELYGNILLEGLGSIYATPSRYQVKAITYSGDFTVDGTIVIDMDKMTVKLNGQNALNDISGDFFGLLAGENEITYTDDSTNRTVRITIEYRDRWV